MWDEPFHVSLLENGTEFIVYCPTAKSAEELFEIFRDYDVRWAGDEVAYSTHWMSGRCYRVKGGYIRRGTKDFYSDQDQLFCQTPKYTFFGVNETSDVAFSVATDSEIISLLQ